MATQESEVGAIGRGIGAGIQNIAAIRGIQKQDEQEARALRQEKIAAELQGQQRTLFNQAQQKWHEENDPIHSAIDVVKRSGLDEAGQRDLMKFAPEFGIDLSDPNKKYSYAKIKEFRDGLLKHPEYSQVMNTHKLRSDMTALSQVESILSQAGNGGIPQEQIDAAMQQKKVIEGRLATNPIYQKQRELESAKTKEGMEAERVGLERERVGIAEKGLGIQQTQADTTAAAQREASAQRKQSYELEKKKYNLMEETQHTTKALEYLKLIGKKELQHVMGDDGTEKWIPVDADPIKTLRKAWSLNPDLMKKGGLQKPPDEKIDWKTSWSTANAKLAKNKDAAANLVPILKESAAAEGITYTENDILDLSKTYPNLKLLAPYFREEKAAIKNEGESGVKNTATGIVSKVFGVDPEWVAAKEQIKKTIGIGGPPEQTTRSRFYSDFRK